jgi:chemotaxis signal transduction protein
LTYTQPAFSLQQFFKKKQTPKNQNANLIANLGEACFYWEVFDPTYKDENEPTLGWLVDDLSDIYRDFKTEIHKIDHIASNEAIIDGLWSLKFGFTSHWGNHCINAIRALHYITYEGKT